MTELVDHAATPPRGQRRRGAVSRRGLLAGAAALAGLAVGTGGTAAAESLTTTNPPDVPPPSQDLMSDHGILKRVLLAYAEVTRRARAGKPVPVPAVHSAAVIVHDYIEGFHEGLEEAYVFPRLRQGRLAGTVRTLLVQHARGRRVTADILRATGADARLTATGTRSLASALDAFTRMYQVHEAREDTVVFPAFRAATSRQARDELAERFAAEQQRRFGRDAFAHLVDRVADIEKDLHIYDLAQFTP